jgi:hypothetical protein
MTQQSRSGGSPAERAEALLTRSRSRFLQALREAAEEVIHHPDWLDAFTGAAGECFDELSSQRPGRGPEDVRGLTASRMNLVHDNETDYSIALINLDQRLHDYCGRDLAALHMRMRMQLVGTPLVLQDESPLGTESVCRALRGLKEAERLSATEALGLLQQLEEPCAAICPVSTGPSSTSWRTRAWGPACEAGPSTWSRTRRPLIRRTARRPV